MNILSNTLINTKNIKGLNIKPTEHKQQQSNIDTDIDNYSVNDILTIFNLVDVEPTLFQIKDVANNLIARMMSEGKKELAIFFEKAKQKIITEIEREMNDTDTDSDSDTSSDDYIASAVNSSSSSSSLSLIGNNWWEEEMPIKSKHSREAPTSASTSGTGTSSGSANNIQRIEYEKNIILEKLRMTEFKLREMEKENKKLKKQVKMLSNK